MTSSDSQPTDPGGPSIEEIARTATLARLALDQEGLEAARTDLTAILEHVALLSSLDVEGVEPMPRPHDIVNRLADDVPGPVLDRSVILSLAPAVEGDFIAVPKVLGEGGA
ncbi:MAG: Asp-tRNA(Asn)/Glu-tRNA(Gln) amidotransferase GatCAB subunit C [Phycisphaerae bacterium]|nr:Asp-tRNA(Asn)/Glu-tRNA(Gln) amidotransferase GatCAB subunit C [Phycisphaerae bacterium]